MSEGDIMQLQEQLQTERQQQEHNQEEIHWLRNKIKRKEVLIEEVFEKCQAATKICCGKGNSKCKRRESQLQQQLAHSQEETRRVQQELTRSNVEHQQFKHFNKNS